MALAFCTTALISSKFGGLYLNSSPRAADHTRPADSLRVFLYLDQSMFPLSRSPARLFVLTGN